MMIHLFKKIIKGKKKATWKKKNYTSPFCLAFHESVLLTYTVWPREDSARSRVPLVLEVPGAKEITSLSTRGKEWSGGCVQPGLPNSQPSWVQVSHCYYRKKTGLQQPASRLASS